MKLLIGNKSDAKPETTLKEKTKGFQFKKPSSQTGTASTNKTPLIVESTKTTTNKSNGNQLLKPKNKPTAPTFKKPSVPIPEMADDKYEVVADSTAELSKVNGDKFQEQLNMLQHAIDGNGQLRDQMINILTFLDDNPQFKDNVGPKDVAVFVNACRKVAGITVTEKTERKSRRTASSAQVEEILDDLADLNFDL